MSGRSGLSSKATSVDALATTTSSRRSPRAPTPCAIIELKATMRDFLYHRPSSFDEARKLAVEDGAMLLAGGQTLLRDMKLGLHFPTSLVDLVDILPNHIELHGNSI